MDGGEQKIYSDQASRNVLTNSEKQEPLRMELCQQAERRREEGQGRTGGQEEEVGAKEGRNRGMEGGLINGSSAISSSLAPGRVQRRDEVGGGRRALPFTPCDLPVYQPVPPPCPPPHPL